VQKGGDSQVSEHTPFDYQDDEEYWLDEEDLYDEDELSCDNCGPWCPDWGGDGLCMVAIEEQARQRDEYVKKHVRDARCPVCGAALREYDVYSGDGKPWTWSAGFYDPMIAVMDVLGPMWLNKGVFHSKDRVHHVWIEWGAGREERLLRYLEENPLEAPR
jgi:hypothetical protein